MHAPLPKNPPLIKIPDAINCKFDYQPSIRLANLVIEIENGAELPDFWQILIEKILKQKKTVDANEKEMINMLLQSAPKSPENKTEINVDAYLENYTILIRYIENPKRQVAGKSNDKNEQCPWLFFLANNRDKSLKSYFKMEFKKKYLFDLSKKFNDIESVKQVNIFVPHSTDGPLMFSRKFLAKDFKLMNMYIYVFGYDGLAINIVNKNHNLILISKILNNNDLGDQIPFTYVTVRGHTIRAQLSEDKYIEFFEDYNLQIFDLIAKINSYNKDIVLNMKKKLKNSLGQVDRHHFTSEQIDSYNRARMLKINEIYKDYNKEIESIMRRLKVDSGFFELIKSELMSECARKLEEINISQDADRSLTALNNTKY